jgi:hypothetical protein
MADKRPLDKRTTPARADLAAAHLKGVVDAPRYVEGTTRSVWVGRAALRVRPSDEAAQDSELLFGESFTVYDRANGWAWGQAQNDSYVGLRGAEQGHRPDGAGLHRPRPQAIGAGHIADECGGVGAGQDR